MGAHIAILFAACLFNALACLNEISQGNRGWGLFSAVLSSISLFIALLLS